MSNPVSLTAKAMINMFSKYMRTMFPLVLDVTYFVIDLGEWTFFVTSWYPMERDGS